MTSHPIDEFRALYKQAEVSESFDASRVALATADARGVPQVRFVLVKQFSYKGFDIFTNYGSTKARHLLENPVAELAWHWHTLGKQVRVRGVVQVLSATESDAYFAARARESQIGAWASRQSEPLEDQAVLPAKIRELEKRFANGPVPRPDFWGGFRLVPDEIEFWTNGVARLHERVLHRRDGESWSAELLYP